MPSVIHCGPGTGHSERHAAAGCERQHGTGVTTHPVTMTLYEPQCPPPPKKKPTLEEAWADLLGDWRVSRVQGSVWKPTTTKETPCEKGCQMWDCFQMRVCSRGPDPLSPRCGTHSTHYAHLQSQASRLRSSLQVHPTTILLN